VTSFHHIVAVVIKNKLINVNVVLIIEVKLINITMVKFHAERAPIIGHGLGVTMWNG